MMVFVGLPANDSASTHDTGAAYDAVVGIKPTLLHSDIGLCLIANIDVNHALRASRLPSLLRKAEVTLLCFRRSDGSREAGRFTATASIAILLRLDIGICLVAKIVVNHALRASRLPPLPQKHPPLPQKQQPAARVAKPDMRDGGCRNVERAKKQRAISRWPAGVSHRIVAFDQRGPMATLF